MPSKKRPTGFRVPKATAEELRAMVEGPPLRPIRCTTRRVVKSTRHRTDVSRIVERLGLQRARDE